MAQWKNICGSNLAHGRFHGRGYCICHTWLRPRRQLLVCSGQPVPPWTHWHPTMDWKTRQSWDADRKWRERLWKVEIRVEAHHSLMTGSLPKARLSPPGQPKQEQIMVLNIICHLQTFWRYAKETVIDTLGLFFEMVPIDAWTPPPPSFLHICLNNHYVDAQKMKLKAK